MDTQTPNTTPTTPSSAKTTNKKKISIDYGALWQSIKKRRKLFYKSMGTAFVLALIIGFSIPKRYVCEVMLAPELSMASSRTSSLSALASSFGMKIGSAALGNEALFPTLYPDLMNSVDFKASLFPVKVHKLDSTRVMTYYDYLLKEQKQPWWSTAIGGVLGGIVELFPVDSAKLAFANKKEVDAFRLTTKQTAIVKALNHKIVCNVDKKTMVITIQVTDQDPWIAATMADSVKARLQDFITEYRTSKARKDLEYNKKIFAEAKREYDKARQIYASFSDANQDVILQSVRMRQLELENELQLKYNTYSTVSLQLHAAQAKVQEDTPAFTTLESATVPIKPAGPQKSKIIMMFLFLAFVGTATWSFYKDNLLKSLLGLS